ncbi:hypothetical protein ANO14919_075750 [Xylariales sp. No.14919]|nr:hypothetical protein ANO14919_075750 [Xylariales sp. No.14919]
MSRRYDSGRGGSPSAAPPSTDLPMQVNDQSSPQPQQQSSRKSQESQENGATSFTATTEPASSICTRP